MNHTAVSTKDDFNIKKGSGFVLPQSDFHTKMFTMTDDELKLTEQALHQSATYRQGPDIRHQATGFIEIMYCHHSQQCFVWQTTPDDMAPWDEETLRAVLKIQDRIYQDYSDRCYRINVEMNIHSEEETERLRWHQDQFEDKLVDLLFTIVLARILHE